MSENGSPSICIGRNHAVETLDNICISPSKHAGEIALAHLANAALEYGFRGENAISGRRELHLSCPTLRSLSPDDQFCMSGRPLSPKSIQRSGRHTTATNPGGRTTNSSSSSLLSICHVVEVSPLLVVRATPRSQRGCRPRMEMKMKMKNTSPGGNRH